jgi:K+-sensing histidine kinase KdpD
MVHEERQGPRRLGRYGLAVALVLAAFAGTATLKRDWNAPTFMFFVPALAVAAWRAGRGPTVVATGLSLLLIDWFLLPPTGLETSGTNAILDFIAFLLLAATIIIVTEALRRARSLAEARAAELETVAVRASKLLEVSTALSEATTVQQVTDVALGKGRGLVEAARGVAIGTDGKRIVLLGDSASPTRTSFVPDGAASDTDFPIRDALRTGDPIWLHSAEEVRRRYPWLYERLHAVSDPQALVAVPLTYLGETIGAISFTFDGASAFGVVDQTFTLLLAQATAAALYRAHGFDVEHQRRRDAEFLAHAREDVLGVVAHDLRNPLNVISGATEMLVEDSLTPAARVKLGDASGRAVRQMERLIADLLDSVRLQAGRLSLTLGEVPIADIVQEAEETFRPLANTKKVDFRVECPPNPGVVHADRVRVAQVLGNLLANAFKFTAASGTVTLRVGVYPDHAVFNVVDTGQGIADVNLKLVFQDFWQARKGDERGVGLGLTIAKALVEAQGGSIWVESALGRGSTFSFTVPRSARATDSAHTRAGASSVRPA